MGKAMLIKKGKKTLSVVRKHLPVPLQWCIGNKEGTHLVWGQLWPNVGLGGNELKDSIGSNLGRMVSRNVAPGCFAYGTSPAFI